MAEILLNLAGISFSHPGRPLFDSLDWEIQDRQRVGLVGPNGAGKSTLLQIARGALAPGRGQLFRAPGVTLGYLPQEPALPEGSTVLTEALTAEPALAAVEAELRRLEARMGEPAVYDDERALRRVLAAHERTLHQYEQLDGASYENRVQAALDQVGLGMQHWDRPVARLSGGQKKLVLLAQLLVRRPRLLLLDEPDNHLDLASKELLESVLVNYPGGVVLISHDRYLLDGVATHIVELSGGKLDFYTGNYSVYATERELRRLRQQQLYAAQQKEIARIEAAIARFEQWAAIVVNERHIRQARSRQRMLDRMERIDPVHEQRRMGLSLDGGRGSRNAVELIDVAQRLPDGTMLWHGLNALVRHGERVALVGPNGAGKSMLLRRLLDPESATSGEIKIGPSSRIGYYDQEHETLDYGRTLLDEIRHAAPLREETVVAFLHRFLFTYDQIRGPIRDLSGGERSRLQLAKLMLEQPNLLLLDEPTNNLDLVSIEVLEEVLAEFEGTVLVVSHDRYFLDRVVDRVLELRDGRLREFLGGYSDYLAAVSDA